MNRTKLGSEYENRSGSDAAAAFIDRRAFIRMAAVAGVAVPAALLSGCSSPDSSVPRDPQEPADAAPETTGPAQQIEPVYEDGVFPRHEPYGAGVGAMPGRVAWAHTPAAVFWDGSGHWWELDNFDDVAVRGMVDGCIASLAGVAESASAGWSRLFEAHNLSRGEASGYQKGQKIAIKANMNGAGTNGRDEESDLGYTNPVLLRALILSLVEAAGVEPEDVTVYDSCRIFPRYMMEYCSQAPLSGIRFSHNEEGSDRNSVPDGNATVVWSQEVAGSVNHVPTCVSEASYLINLANLKGHSYGMTLCAKNHFGTLMNDSRLRPPEAAGIHRYLTNNAMGAYTVLVDLLSNHLLGQKTVLWVHDALICATSEGSRITREAALWQSAPFSGHFTASVFMSQDPLALDSVGADFLMNEPAVTSRNSTLANNPNVENYLHEAGLAANPPSGAVYLDGAGNRVENIGVHEHWDNPADKRYGRNLGADEGIELVLVDA